jgi:hypothetical protein
MRNPKPLHWREQVARSIAEEAAKPKPAPERTTADVLADLRIAVIESKGLGAARRARFDVLLDEFEEMLP